MKTKNQFTKQLFSIVLCLVLMLSHVPLTVFAATYNEDIYVLEVNSFDAYFNGTGELTRSTQIDDIVDVDISVDANNQIVCSFKVKYKDSIGKTRTSNAYKFTVENKSCTEVISHDFVATDKPSGAYHYKVEGKFTRKARTEHTGGQNTCVVGAVCSVCGIQYGSADPNAHSWGEWTVTDTTHSRTCTLNSEHTESGICSGGTATCDSAPICSTCGKEYGNKLGHSFQYNANKNVITETCENGCGHTATATLTANAVVYTGSPVTTGASVAYSEDWHGEKLQPSEIAATKYTNNINAGTATVTTTVEGKELTTTFKINAADISNEMINLSPENGTYNGSAYTPSITVTFGGAALVKDTDYTISWDKDGFAAPDTYTVRVEGVGNFTGYVDKSFKINAANLSDVKVEQVGTLTYNGGNALTPTVSANAVAVNNQQITFTYRTDENSDYGDMPSFTEAGTYTVYFKAAAPNHNEATGSFTVTVNKAIVTEPTIASKVYNGSVQTADIADTDLYTVVENNGGTGVLENGKGYNVVLKLTDPENYKWSSTDEAEVTLSFKITRATNEWEQTPSIEGWTYAETEKVPVGTAKFGEVSVQYTGTANDGTQFNSITAPTKAGNYTATFIVAETENYSGLETSVDFTIAKADYDMSNAQWAYTDAFDYDGTEKTVVVTDLPNGVTVSGYEGNKATVVGNYTAKVTLSYDGNNYNKPILTDLPWSIVNTWQPTEYTVTDLNGNGWINGDFEITAADGYQISLNNTANGEWKDSLTYSDETDNGSVTFYLKNEANGTISLAKTVNYQLDKTVPTGRVEFDERNGWEEFLNTISFGLFYKDEVTIKVATDNDLSGIAKIEYASSDKAMTLNEVKEIADWTEYNGRFGVTKPEAEKFVYFIRITDNAGNVTYLSTNGAQYDTTAPVISGIENGKTYYTTQKVSVSDTNIDIVTVNGTSVFDPSVFSLPGNTEAEFVISATDKAGNSTTVTVTMKPLAELGAPIDNITENDVKSSDKDTIQNIIEMVDELLSDDDLTDDEKAALEEIKSEAEKLVDKIDEVAKAIDTENVENAKDVTVENVTPEDKTDLEKAKADLEKALEDNGGNYTEDEKKAVEDEIKRIDDALEVIDNVEEAEELIDKLPAVDTVKPDDEEAIKAITEAQTAYNALSDYEKSLVDEDNKANLDKLVAALVAYDIVEGDGSSWTEDSDHSITFVVNGLFSKFVGIKVDGKNVDKANYEVKAGSTIITLKASYLDTLKVGEHTITVVYTDGSTDGSFNVHANANSPATGDNSNIWLWFALLFVSGAGVFGITLYDRKRKAAGKR